jgi:hypothetical protein
LQHKALVIVQVVVERSETQQNSGLKKEGQEWEEYEGLYCIPKPAKMKKLLFQSISTNKYNYSAKKINSKKCKNTGWNFLHCFYIALICRRIIVFMKTLASPANSGIFDRRGASLNRFIF